MLRNMPYGVFRCNYPNACFAWLKRGDMLTIQDDLLSFRRRQVDEDWHLLPMPSDLYILAGRRLTELQDELLSNPHKLEEIQDKGANITQAVKDIRDTRGWLMFSLAWSEDGKRDFMTADEWKAYEVLRDIGKSLRRE
jgi:hypothetical protein